jgi:hypothetical protein
MIDCDDERIDFTGLGGPEPLQEESVVRAAMLRIRAAPAREPVLEGLAVWWRPGLAAAVLLFALGMALARQRPSGEESVTALVEARMIDWALGGHVPSNGELLASFWGYAR